jgi:uncharacterized membrane protein
MSLPFSESFDPEEKQPLPQPPLRRRKRRRNSLPSLPADRAEFAKDLALEVTTSIDFFIYTLLAGVILGLAILLDAPVLYFLAALVSPLMAPVIGISLASVFGSGRFFLRESGSMLIGAVLIFVCGVVAGWVSKGLFQPASIQTALLHTSFTWTDIIVLTLAAVVVNTLIVRSPQSHLMWVSAVLAYELYIPVAVAGYGLASGAHGLFPDALIVFAVHLAWAALVGTAVIVLAGLRPGTAIGYTLGSSLLLIAIVAVVAISGLGTALTSRVNLPAAPALSTVKIDMVTPISTPIPARGITPPAPTITATIVMQGPPKPTPTATHTLIPSLTPSITPSIAPTPVYARVRADASNGAFIRQSPTYNSKILLALLNGALVQVLPEESHNDGAYWLHVRSADGIIEGWILRTLVSIDITTTPPPS